jgi:hypothetical protein
MNYTVHHIIGLNKYAGFRSGVRVTVLFDTADEAWRAIERLRLARLRESS